MSFRMTPRRWGAFALAWAGLVTACVRLSAPDNFICSSDADCEADQKCPNTGAECVAKDFCEPGVIGCETRQHCAEHKCVADECDSGSAANSCHGYACVDGVCLTSCSAGSNCAPGFRCANTQCAVRLANDSACQDATDCTSNACCPASIGSLCKDKCPAANGAVCKKAEDCASGYCCAGFNQSSCSATACGPPP
jgi:hypothetical protein